MSSFVFCYTTVPDQQAADKIARVLVQQKLAACVNCIPNVQSYYCWEQEVRQVAEIVLLIKTRDALYEDLQKKIQALHPYDCPAILKISIQDGFKDFLDWVSARTKHH